MARYIAQVRTTRPVDEVFAYMADLRNIAVWDPSVACVTQVEGKGGGVDAVFDVTVRGPKGRETTMRYRTMSFDPPEHLTVRAETKALVSLDRVKVSDEGGTTRLEYEAGLRLKGWRGVADPLLRRMFDRYGRDAAEGLARVLDGTLVSS